MIKQLQYKLHKFYFLLLTLLYWKDNAILLNPIAIVSTVWLIYILSKQKKELSLVHGITILALTIYLLLAFLSDFYKITTFDKKAIKFVNYGSLLVVLNFVMSILLIYNNSILVQKKIKKEP